MRYLLPCECGQSVEIEPSQAGQTVVCGCGKELLAPSMLQIKALPVAPDKPAPPREKVNVPYKALLYKTTFATLIPGIACLTLSIPLWWWFGLSAVFFVFYCVGIALSAISLVGVLWMWKISDETNATYMAALVMFVAGILFAALSLPIGWLGWYVGLNGNFVFRVCLALGFALAITSPITVLRFLIRPEDVNILSRTFFTLGTVLLFLSLLLAISLYLLPPDPRQALDKRVFFTFGSLQRSLFQDSTPIPMEERTILWMTDEIIDQMMPMELHFYFQTLEEPMFSFNFLENYEAVWATYRIWVTVNIILAILALLSITVSFFMPRQNVVVTGWSGTEW